MELNNRILSIKHELKRQKITYEKLSVLSGISLATLKTIFSGRAKNPRIDTIEAIERVIYFNYGNPYKTEKEKNRSEQIKPPESDIQLIYDALNPRQQVKLLAYAEGLLAANDLTPNDLK